MTLEDIENFKIKYNIDRKSRKHYYIFNRMYLYSMLFYIHKLSLAKIGVMFGTDHSTVRNALIAVSSVQHTETFQDAVKPLTDQHYFIVPEYQNTFGNRAKKDIKKKDKFFIKIEVTKNEYMQYMQKKNPLIVYDRLWDLMLKNQNK